MTKIALASIAFIILTTIIVVLWQRQPKAPVQTEVPNVQTAIQSQKHSENITPKDGSVVKSKTVKIEGKAEPNTTVALYSNSFQEITKSKSDGIFEKEATLEDGLNLVRIVYLDQNLEIAKQTDLTLFASEDDVGNTVAAGSVKSIFDNLITITTTAGDIHTRTSNSTKFDVPKEEDVKEATSEVDNIRIGDYAVTLGDASDQDSIVAKNFKVIRENKPQIEKQFIATTVASAVRQNLFSAKNKKDNRIIEFTFNKNSQISLDGKTGKNTDIKKDQTALIFYTKSDDENIIAQIYLLSKPGV